MSRFLKCSFCPWKCLVFKGRKGGRPYPQHKKLAKHVVQAHPTEWKQMKRSIRRESRATPR